MFGMKGRRYKLWWSGYGDVFGGVGVMVKKEQCEEVVEVGWVSDRVMALVVFIIECAEVNLRVCSTKWKRFGVKTVIL